MQAAGAQHGRGPGPGAQGARGEAGFVQFSVPNCDWHCWLPVPTMIADLDQAPKERMEKPALSRSVTPGVTDSAGCRCPT